MDADLSRAIAAMGTFALFLGGVTWKFVPPVLSGEGESDRPTVSDRRQSRLAGAIVGVCAMIGLLLMFVSKDHLYWAHLCRDSAAIIWTNLTVPFLAIAAGASIRLPDRPLWRRALGAMCLAGLSVAALLQPILQPIFRPVSGGNQWATGGVCIQSRTTTCSPAAAATLLAAHGVNATEAQLVDTCLTDVRGTPSLGTWRGLKLATHGTKWRPRVAKVSVDELVRVGPFPAVLFVGLPAWGADPIYQNEYGWDPGFRHSVVLFGRKADGMMDVGDPSIGREAWSEQDVRVLWRGEAIYLEPVGS